MSERTVYLVTWREGGREVREPYASYLAAEAAAREKSRVVAPRAVLIESRARYIHARWEMGAQTLARALTLMEGTDL